MLDFQSATPGSGRDLEQAEVRKEKGERPEARGTGTGLDALNALFAAEYYIISED